MHAATSMSPTLPAGAGAAGGDVRRRLDERLRRVQQGQAAVGDLADRARACAATSRRGRSASAAAGTRSRASVRQRPAAARDVGRRGARAQRPDGDDGLARCAAAERRRSMPGPAEEVRGPGGEPEEEAAAAELLQRRRRHRDLGGMHRVGVEHARAERDPSTSPPPPPQAAPERRGRTGRWTPRSGRTPAPRRSGELDELGDRHVVVEPQAEASFERQPRSVDSRTTASTSTSTRKSSPTRPWTNTMVLAGRTAPSAAAWAADAACQSARGNEEDARAHDVVDRSRRGPRRRPAPGAAPPSVCAPVSPGCRAPPWPSLAVVPLTVIELPRRTARAYPATCSCPPPSKYRSAGDRPHAGTFRPTGWEVLSTVTHPEQSERSLVRCPGR